MYTFWLYFAGFRIEKSIYLISRTETLAEKPCLHIIISDKLHRIFNMRLKHYCFVPRTGNAVSQNIGEFLPHPGKTKVDFDKNVLLRVITIAVPSKLHLIVQKSIFYFHIAFSCSLILGSYSNLNWFHSMLMRYYLESLSFKIIQSFFNLAFKSSVCMP